MPYARTGSLEFCVLTPEDVVLAKLECLKAGSSDRQKHDILGILHAQQGRLDMDYLADWAQRLGVRDLLNEALTGRWKPS